MSTVSTFIEYDSETGRIICSRSMPTDQEALNPPLIGTERLYTDIFVDPLTAYVLDGELTPRPILVGFDKTQIQADGADIAKITLPEPMKFKLDGEESELPTAILELVTDMPATWVIEIDHFPYRLYRAEIVAS